MTDTKINTSIRYVGEALAAIVKLLLPGDRVRAEFGPDLIIESVAKAGTFTWGLLLGGKMIRHEAGLPHSRLTALTVLSLAPRPDPEPWWAGADMVLDNRGRMWPLVGDKYRRGSYTLTATELNDELGPCEPIRQDGRTILSEAEIEKVAAEVLYDRTVPRVLTELHGWREEEK